MHNLEIKEQKNEWKLKKNNLNFFKKIFFAFFQYFVEKCISIIELIQFEVGAFIQTHWADILEKMANVIVSCYCCASVQMFKCQMH